MTNLYFFCGSFCLHIVPAPTVTGDKQNIAYYINQSSIYTLNKIEQEEPQTVDKQTFFSRFQNDISGTKISSAMQIGW